MVFRIIDEPSGIIPELTGGELSLHHKVGSRSPHLTRKVWKLHFWNYFLKTCFKLIYLFFFSQKFFLKLLNFAFQLKNCAFIRIIVGPSNDRRQHILFLFWHLWYHLIDFIVLNFLLLEVNISLSLLLSILVGLFLNILH